jgi:hypothetical protein
MESGIVGKSGLFGHDDSAAFPNDFILDVFLYGFSFSLDGGLTRLPAILSINLELSLLRVMLLPIMAKAKTSSSFPSA